MYAGGIVIFVRICQIYRDVRKPWRCPYAPLANLRWIELLDRRQTGSFSLHTYMYVAYAGGCHSMAKWWRAAYADISSLSRPVDPFLRGAPSAKQSRLFCSYLISNFSARIYLPPGQQAASPCTPPWSPEALSTYYLKRPLGASCILVTAAA